MTFDHVNNFLECVRTRNRPNGDVLIGHRSAQASHLGNIAYVEKRRFRSGPGRDPAVLRNDTDSLTAPRYPSRDRKGVGAFWNTTSLRPPE